MNPHSHDYRDTVRAGEKTGSPFQAFRPKPKKLTPWMVLSTLLSIALLAVLMVFLPESPPW